MRPKRNNGVSRYRKLAYRRKNPPALLAAPLAASAGGGGCWARAGTEGRSDVLGACTRFLGLDRVQDDAEKKRPGG